VEKVSREGTCQPRKTMLRTIISGNLDGQFLKYYMAANWVLLGLMVTVAGAISSFSVVVGILVGGIIANLNSIGLERDCRRTVRCHNKGSYYSGFVVRLVFITVAVLAALLIFPEALSPVGLFIGLSTGVINFYILALAMVIHRVHFKEAV